MWHTDLKEAGISVHVIATGAASGLQNLLWEVPGSSAYLSGATFPYSPEEQEQLLGFMPEHFCNEDTAIDLASAAYMQSYKLGSKKPVGLGLTASVASTRPHKGDHRAFGCVITDDKIWTKSWKLHKGCGPVQRQEDGLFCDEVGFYMLMDVLGIRNLTDYQDGTEAAKERFFLHPFFAANGKRLATMPDTKHSALMSGAYNPPHEGHFGLSQQMLDTYNRRVVFEITAEPPHKDALSVQDMLKRSKLLQGNDRFFTRKTPLYIDKARAFPSVPLVMGADAAVRLLDPKWGISVQDLLKEFKSLGTKIYVAGRQIDGKFINASAIIDDISFDILKSSEISGIELEDIQNLIQDIPGRWDISSTELRNK
jgi:nicotinic acid mononucleotide adenylyltransferase